MIDQQHFHQQVVPLALHIHIKLIEVPKDRYIAKDRWYIRRKLVLFNTIHPFVQTTGVKCKGISELKRGSELIFDATGAASGRVKFLSAV